MPPMINADNVLVNANFGTYLHILTNKDIMKPMIDLIDAS